MKKEKWEEDFRALYFNWKKNEDFFKCVLLPFISQTRKQAQKEILERVRLDRERLADLEHQKWMSWTKYIAKGWVSKLPPKLKLRWVKNWKPYSELDEKTKDADRKWADKIVADLEAKKKEIIKSLEK